MKVKIGIIGYGKMGQAFGEGFMAKKYQVKYFDVRKIKGVKARPDSLKKVSALPMVFLCIKPQDLARLGFFFQAPGLLVSILAGVSISGVEKNLGLGGGKVVRVMPNLPLTVGRGIFGVTFSSRTASRDKKNLRTLLGELGEVIEFKESQMDAVTGLSGSGPAFVWTFMEAMAQGGVLCGLSYDHAMTLVRETIIGSVEMTKDKRPGSLIKDVTSPGGSTIHGLLAYEKKGGTARIMEGVRDAVKAAAIRSGQLGE